MIDSGALIDYNTLRNVTEPKISNLQDCNAVRTPQPTDWPTFACAPTGAAPAPQSDVRAYCEAQLSEQAESQFESVHIGAFDGRNIQPNPIQRGNAKGMAWIVVHSPTSISFRLEASSMTGPPVAVHFHGPASALGVRAGANPLPGQGATGPTLLPIYATKEYTGNTEKKDDILGERSDACPVVGSAGEEVRCERLRMEVHPNVTEHLKRGRVYVNIHTLSHPAGEIRANLRETFVSVLDSPNRDVKADEEDDAKGLDPPEIVRLRQGQGVATFYMLDDGVDFVRLPSVDFSILVGNLLPGATGSPNKISIVRDENVQSSPTTVAPAAPSDDASPAESTATAVQGEVLQILCADASAIPFGVSIAGVRSCSTGENAGCYGNAPPDNLPEGTIVLAGGGTAATTTNVGICGPFTPLPLQNSRTPTGPRTSVGGGAVLDLATDTIQAANETVRAMRTRRASIVVESRTQGILVQGTLRSAVAVAYALPPLATKPIRMSGSFISLPGTSPPSKSPFIPTGSSIGTAKIAPSNAAGIATVRLIDPRSFAYVIELFELSGVPTNGIFIRGPGLRARTRTSQLVIHTIASPMVGNGTAAIRAATQNCELVSAALTVCAGTVRDIDESMIVALLSGQLYIDVRTARYPFGEMRAVIGEDVTTITGADGSTSAGSTAESCGTPLARNLGLSYGGAWAKAFGQCLNFNCALVLYPILRYILRKCNNYDSKSVNGGLSSWIPLHRNIDFHKLIAFAIAVCTAGHIVAHFLNYGRAPDATIARFHWHSWLTGALITFSMLFIFSGGQANVKRAHYELFFVTHRTFAVIFCVCLLFHSSGPLFWALGPAGMFLYLLEVVLRRYRGSQHFFVRSVRYVPPVMQLKFRPRHPDDFRFMEGQYLYLKCPYVSSNEWHPFTISSACGDLDQGGEEGWLSVHIRIIKDGWTENLLRYFSAMDGRDVNADDVGENELFLQLTSRDAKGQIQIGKDRGVNGKPLLLVDGPHAAPAQHYSTYDHVMMIGAGIGLTPSCSVLRSVLKYKWKKGWKPTLLRFYWVVRHSEIDSFLWFLEQLVQLEKEIIADRAAGTICNIHIFEANIYITRAPKADKCKETPLSISERVQDLLLTFKSTARRSNSVTRGLAPSPLAQKSHHVGIDMVSGGSGSDSKTATGNSGKRRSMVAQAGLAQTVDIGYDIEALYQTMYNPTVVSKKQTEAQQPQNIDMAENRLGKFISI
jgi:NAD(P)H-flavin reductase